MDKKMLERLAFLEINNESQTHIDLAYQLITPKIKQILDGFYDHLLQFEQTKKIIKDNSSVDILKKAQGNHWDMLLKMEFNDVYFQHCLAIGRAHQRIGLTPRWYMGGYRYILTQMTNIILENKRKIPRRIKIDDIIATVQKVVFLDMDLAVDAYFQAVRAQSEQRITKISEELEERIKGSTDIVASASKQLETAANTMILMVTQLNEGTEHGLTVARKSGDHATSLSETTQDLNQEVTKIRDDVQNSSQTFTVATNAVTQTEEQIQELSKAGESIGDIISLIQKIANQTNLLALNATIEAARAGAAGRGFAVVASEVKSLALQTAQATDDISSQIEQIQDKTKTAVSSIGAISTSIDDLGTISQRIDDGITHQASEMNEIAETFTTVAGEIGDMHDYLVSVNSLSQETSALAEQVFSAAQDLSGEAKDLDHVMQQFLDDIHHIEI